MKSRARKHISAKQKYQLIQKKFIEYRNCRHSGMNASRSIRSIDFGVFLIYVSDSYRMSGVGEKITSIELLGPDDDWALVVSPNEIIMERIVCDNYFDNRRYCAIRLQPNNKRNIILYNRIIAFIEDCMNDSIENISRNAISYIQNQSL